jgi:hypothetical protein
MHVMQRALRCSRAAAELGSLHYVRRRHSRRARRGGARGGGLQAQARSAEDAARADEPPAMDLGIFSCGVVLEGCIELIFIQ